MLGGGGGTGGERGANFSSGMSNTQYREERGGGGGEKKEENVYEIHALLSVYNSFKGVCHKIFDLQFFHDSNPTGPLINRLKYFRIWFLFRQDIR